jgi:hypothetical protein
MNFTQTMMAAAVSGILSGVSGCASEPPPPAESPASAAAPTEAAPADAAPAGAAPAPEAEKHACKGQNTCAGRGGCKTDKHDCKGKNECKGQGGCKTT